ncbi:MAG: hypothetical protein ACK5Q5_23385 [Planctomycetaceae bacterium]
MKHWWLLIATGVWLGLSGCGGRVESPPAASNMDEANAPPIAAVPLVEPSWDQQVSAVRQGTTSAIRFSGQVTPAQWSQLYEGCEGLLVLSLPEAQIGDSQLGILVHLSSLRQLVLGGPIGDEGLSQIAACSSLEILNLPRGRFGDIGLKKLQHLPLLTLLRFGSPNVTDAGFDSLAGMPNLRFLHLLRTPITDTGLDHVKRCPLLESFYIDGGDCTEEGLSCLLKSHPGLHLHVNQLHLAGDEHADGH